MTKGLSPEDVTAGWIAWSGGECPVDVAQRVEVRMRLLYSLTARSEALVWKHSGDATDIIAYRFLGTPQRQEVPIYNRGPNYEPLMVPSALRPYQPLTELASVDGLEVLQVLSRIRAAMVALADDAPDETPLSLRAGDIATVLESFADCKDRLSQASQVIGEMRGDFESMKASRDFVRDLLKAAEADAARLRDIVQRCVTALDVSRDGGDVPCFEEWEADARQALAKEAGE